MKKILNSFWTLVKRFWWVLVLLGFGLIWWIRDLQSKARLSDGLKVQREIETKAETEWRESARKTRLEQVRVRREIEQSRVAWDQKKMEIEREIAQNDSGLADAWARAFGKQPVRAGSESESK